MTKVRGGVIGTSLKLREVEAFSWLALVPRQCSGCKEGWVINRMDCCFLSVT